MRNYILMFGFAATSLLNGMNFVDADWFYNPECPYKSANELCQQRKWGQAEEAYTALLESKTGDQRDQLLASINRASCQAAQRKAFSPCQAFDTKDATGVVVETNQIGIGDIAHFLPVMDILKRTGIENVSLVLRKFLHPAFRAAADKYGITLLSEIPPAQTGNPITHLIRLLAHFQLEPSQLRLAEPLLSADEYAVGRVKTFLNAELNNDEKRMAVVFLGENRMATLMGGKQLPRDQQAHGRQLNAQAFQELLSANKDLVLIDCNPSQRGIVFHDQTEYPSHHLSISFQFRSQVKRLPEERDAFDTTIALAQVMNVDRPNAVGFASDNGPANVFARALTAQAQRRFTYIIPNPEEYDARMEGEGESYEQMISHCPVRKSQHPSMQSAAILAAHHDMQQQIAEQDRIRHQHIATQPVCGCTNNCTSNCPNPGMPEVEGRMWEAVLHAIHPPASDNTLMR